jgi:hypothetical protein
MRWIITLFSFLIFSSQPAIAASIVTGVMADQRRDRSIPIKAYLPAKQAPLILFSPGLGASRDSYAYLARYWADHGLAVVVVQHPGTDHGIYHTGLPQTQAIAQTVQDPRNAFHRPQDVRFVLDRLTEMNQEPGSPFYRRLNMKRVGMAGHSFGAWTTQVLMGQTLKFNGKGPFRFQDKRLKAGLVLSPSVPSRLGQRDPDFSPITAPMLFVSGTEDESPVGETPPESRKLPYQLSGSSYRFWVDVQGADHMFFTGRTPSPALSALEKTTLAFWQAFLLNDPTAARWLGQLKQHLNPLADVEVQSPAL